MEFVDINRPDLGCILVKWRGTFRATAALAFIARQHRKTFFQTGCSMFHDMRSLDFDVPAHEIQRVGQAQFDPVPGNRERRLAFVTGTELGYGMIRMMISYRHRTDMHHEAFRTVADARAWLGLPEAIGDPFEQLTPAWD